MSSIDPVSIDQRSSPAQKITLFRSLFRGREDVYPQRFESRTSGRSGYAPACGNEWVPGVCGKPRIKCAECPNSRFLAVTDDAIRGHLLGADEHGKPFVMGVYPMLLDETCHFVAVDFDGLTWGADAGERLPRAAISGGRSGYVPGRGAGSGRTGAGPQDQVRTIAADDVPTRHSSVRDWRSRGSAADNPARRDIYI